MNCWDAEIQTTQMCTILLTHKDCVGAISSYTHPSYIKVKSSGCNYDCNSAQKRVRWAAAHHGYLQHCLELNPQLMCQHKAPRPILWKRYGVWWERCWSAPAGKGAAVSTSCTQKGELEEVFGSHRPPPWRRVENKALLCNNLQALSAGEVWGEWLKQEDITDPNK